MSFWELLICGVVALIVLGPERLPGAIRSTSRFIHNIRQFGQQMKAELGDELRTHELHQKLKDAEAKGLLNLTAEEIAALTELRSAAASVNQPYAQNSTAVKMEQLLPSAAPASASQTTTESHEQRKDS